MSSGLRHSGANKLVWVMLAGVMLGLGGFGITNFGGGATTIGRVGSHDINVNDYARSFRREIQAFSAQIGKPVTMDMARTLGIDRAVQQQVFAEATYDNEADKLGVSVGDEEVRRRILAIKAFQGLDGTFNRDSYKLTLQQNGMTETQFEAQLRAEAARGLLQGAVAGGVAAPETFVRVQTAWANQTRDFTLAQLLPSDLPEPVPAPTEAQIKTYFDANPGPFTRPETRNLTYVWLSPDSLADKVKVDEQALKDAYQARLAEFVIPETRMVERLVYPSEAEAAAARARVDARQAKMEDLARERGLSLTDIDLGEMTKKDLGAAGDAVFAMTAPGIVGPLPSDLGPALYAMNGIIDAKETSFEEARDELSQAIVQDRARRMVADESDKISDLLASGATLEDVAKESGMTIGKVAFNSESEGGIVGYAPFREAAGAVTDQDFPELRDLDDGGVFALRLDSIDPPALKPLDAVREDVAAAWTKDETHARLVALGQEIMAQIDNGATLDSLGLVTTAYKGFARSGFVEGAAPDVVQKVFTLAEGKNAVVDTPDGVSVVAVSKINAADPKDADVAAMADALRTKLGQSVANDVLDLYTAALQSEAKVSINQSAIEAVQAQLQ